MEQPPYTSASNSPDNDMPKLSLREQEVLHLLAKDHSYKMIAEQMGIANSTVPTFIKRIYTKLKVHSAAGAVGKVLGGRG